MDTYTKACATWLDQRFRSTDNYGIYYPHAPVYGYDRHDPRFEKFYYDWLRTASVLGLLTEVQFSNAADVGSAEGYLAASLRTLFGVPVYCVEIAPQALRRAYDLYELDGVTADAHSLPFTDNAFDLVTCLEVVEHVVDPARVIAELVRITRKVLIVTTPARWDRSLGSEHLPPDSGQLHEHIHLFTDEDLVAQFGVPEEQVMLYGIRPQMRGINRLHLTVIRNRPPLWVTWFLLLLNQVLAQPLRRYTQEFLAIILKDHTACQTLALCQRACWRFKVLNYLLWHSARPRLYLQRPEAE